MRSALATIDEPRRDGSEDVSALLERASAGDACAWRELLERYAPRVFALVRSRVRDGDLAEEVTQSVFVTIAEKLCGGAYAERGRFEAWLFRVAMNRVRDEARRKRRQAVPTAPEMFGALADTRSGRAGSDHEGEDRFDRLRGAIERLSPADQEVIHLRHQGQLSFRQIADLLEEPLGTLLARHHRALRKLKQMLAQDAEVES